MSHLDRHEKICPFCGKVHYPPDLNTYVYQVKKKVDRNHSKAMYFCKYSCKKAWEAEHAKEIVEDDDE